MKPKRKNVQDATLKNIRAIKRRMELLEKRLWGLMVGNWKIPRTKQPKKRGKR